MTESSRDEALVAAAIFAASEGPILVGQCFAHAKEVLSYPEIRTALAGEAKAETPWSVTGEPWETYLDRQREKYAALEAENARLGHERDAWRSSSTRLAAERDGLREERDTALTQRDEFQRRMLEAEKQLRSYQESYEILAKERDALAAKVKDVEAARDRAESGVNALLQTDHALGKAVAIYSAIRAAAKE